MNDADGDLTRSILLTLGTVLLADAAFVVVLAFLARPWLAPLAGATGLPLSGLVAAFGAVALAALVWLQMRYTRREALASVDASVASEADRPELYDRVGRLARQADVERPAVAVADTPVPNSFTVGGPGDAVVVVSEGLLETLSDDELDAVLAHELAHVLNRDAAVMTLAGFLPALTSDRSVLASVGGRGTRVAAWLVAVVVLYPLGAAAIPAPLGSPTYTAVFLALLVATAVVGSAALGALAAPVLVLARRLSRYREFAADRAGALAVGDPGALAGALRRLDATTDASRATETVTDDAVRGLCLMPYGFDAGRADGSGRDAGETATDADGDFRVEWRSHPPVATRVDRLGTLAAELER